MSEVTGTLTPEIRGAKAAERPAGHQVASGANPNAKPVLARQAASPTLPCPARRDQRNAVPPTILEGSRRLRSR